MPQISENWAEALEPGLFEVFETYPTKERLPDHVKELFAVRSSKKKAEHALGKGSIGTMKAWEDTGNQVFYDEIAKGYQINWTNKKYSNGLQVERELSDDKQYDEIFDNARDLAFSVYYTRQQHGASVFNNAFSAGGSYAWADGKALCAANHALVPGSSTTITNFSALALTAPNLTTVRTAIKGWKDDRGNIIPSRFDTLVVPPSKWEAATVIVGTNKAVDSGDNNVNVWQGMLKVIEWELLEDTDAWFLIDSARAKRDLIWWDRRVPSLERDGTFTFDTEVAKWKTVGRWSFGAKTPLFVYGCNPA